jgi:hypothetical protein
LFDVVVASITVETAGGGTTVNELVERIHARLGVESQFHMKLDQLVHDTLGRDWATARLERFDAKVASNSLRFIDALTIPSIATPLPEGVTNVSFVADAASGRVLHRVEMSAAGGLWRAAWPSERA